MLILKSTSEKLRKFLTASKLVGRGDSGDGDFQEITIGSGLTMTGTTLSATGGGGGLTQEQVEGLI